MKSSEIIEYFKVLCQDDFPYFIEPYLDTDTLNRISGVGLFCGVDYNKIPMFDLKYWYSRLDHSIACACIAWHLTKSKKQTIAALLHDVGTPVFSHCVDFMLNDTLNQASSERSTYQTIMSDRKLLAQLAADKISVSDVCFIGRYTVIENGKPKICADRLEGILSTGLVWQKFWTIDDIDKIYSDIIVTKNEQQELEIAFSNVETANLFFAGAHQYAMGLQSNEDKLSMHFVGDILRYMIEHKYLEFNDLFILTEQDVINLIMQGSDEHLKNMWLYFTNLDRVERSSEHIGEKYCIAVEAKKRYVDPLVKERFATSRLSEISEFSRSKLEEYLFYEDEQYAYLDLPHDTFHVRKRINK